jgi:hypothetical protein
MPVIANTKVGSIGSSEWKEVLLSEKVQLAKELGRIDKRFAEIEIELGKIGTQWNDSLRERTVEPPPPPKPKFTMQGDYTHEFMDSADQTQRKDGLPWYDLDKQYSHRALVMPGVEVWPVRESEKTAALFILIAGASTLWKSPQAFMLESTKHYYIPDGSSVKQHIVFVEYIHQSYVGFFIRKQDLQLVKVL